MSKRLVLYPDVPRVQLDCRSKNCPVVPRQSMTLQEVLRRFMKKESLPVAKEGTYSEGEYDLEKLAKADRTIQDDVLQSVKEDVKVKKAKAEKAVRDSKVQRDPQAVPPTVEPPIVPT